MDSFDILNAIEEIASNTGKLEKERLLKINIGDETFCRVLEYAYNPFKIFGIRKPLQVAANGKGFFTESTWKLLDDLIARRLTGNAAIEAVRCQMSSMNYASAELLWRIITKDLRAGFSESTINKVKKGLIPQFPYMRCSLPKDVDLTKWNFDAGVISQEKADGMFANIDVTDDGDVFIRSRQGSEFKIDNFGWIVNEIKKLGTGVQYHGEIVVERNGKILDREVGNGVLNSVLKGGEFASDETPVYFVWDQIALKDVKPKGEHTVPYATRLRVLAGSIKSFQCDFVRLIPTKIVHCLSEAYAHAGQLMKLGKEGTVIKNPNMIWKDGTSKGQVKIKLEFEVDLIITDIVPGSEGTKNEGRAGSFRCTTSDIMLVVDVTVKNEALRNRVDNDNDEFIGKVITVIANDIMEPGPSNERHSLFLPRMAEADYRTDKTTADTLQRVFDQKQAAIFGEKLKEAA